MKKSVFTVFSSIVLGASLVACSDSGMEPVEKEQTPAEEAVTEETPAETTEEAEVEEETAEENSLENLKLGDAVQYGDALITVNSVRKHEGSANTYDEPTNDFYLIFDVAIENQGTEPVNISSMLNFELFDSESYAQDLSIFVETRGSLDGEVGAGRKLAGEIAFDVVDSESYEFAFSDPFASGKAIWQITKADFE